MSDSVRGATPIPRRKVFQHPWRVAIVLLGLLAVVNLLLILSNSSDSTPGGSARPLPPAIDSITPERGELTGLVANVEVDLRNDLTGDLVVDGYTIPENELDRVAELGQISFRPGPDKAISRFRVGENEVVVHYWPRTRARPAHPLSFGWTFRASA